jgi:glutamyl/glutaminyl-tRNA synthetase
MRPEPWTEHPAIRSLDGPVRTRLGVSPHHSSFQVGALRTHLLTAAFAHAAAQALSTAVRVMLRWDDTDHARASGENEAALLRELTEIADIPLASEATELSPTRQSDRHHAYQQGLDRLNDLGLTRPAPEGGIALDLRELEAFLTASRIDTAARTGARLVNVRRAPEPQHATLRLTRSDGTMLWHLATVIDDIDFGVNLIVRGTDKIDATGIQERLRAVLAPDHQAAYLFLPRLSTAAGTPTCRVRDVLSDGISIEAEGPGVFRTVDFRFSYAAI